MSRLEQLHKLHKADPADSDVAYMIALELAKAGNEDESVIWYNRCLEIDPDYLYAYFHKAKTLESAGSIELAVASLEEGVVRAKAAGDGKAIGELGEYLTQLQSEIRESMGDA